MGKEYTHLMHTSSSYAASVSNGQGFFLYGSCRTKTVRRIALVPQAWHQELGFRNMWKTTLSVTPKFPKRARSNRQLDLLVLRVMENDHKASNWCP